MPNKQPGTTKIPPDAAPEKSLSINANRLIPRPYTTTNREINQRKKVEPEGGVKSNVSGEPNCTVESPSMNNPYQQKEINFDPTLILFY